MGWQPLNFYLDRISTISDITAEEIILRLGFEKIHTLCKGQFKNVNLSILYAYRIKQKLQRQTKHMINNKDNFVHICIYTGSQISSFLSKHTRVLG